MVKIPGITIIGLGALGSTLTKALAANGVQIKSVFSRTPQRVQEISRAYDIDIASSFPDEATQLGDLVFLTVTDAAIAETADKLAVLDGDLRDKIFVHCSGNESAVLLDKLKEKGARTASMHPLQTFNVYSDPTDFNNIYFSLQGEAAAFSTLGEIAKLLGANTFIVNEQQKSHLHVAAVMASNYLITLLEASTETGSLSGLDEEQLRKVLAPLIQTTFMNLKSTSFEEAISGPIVRGDVETVNKHLKLLNDQKELRTFYAALGLKTVDKAEETDKLKQDSAEKFRQLFNKIKR